MDKYDREIKKILESEKPNKTIGEHWSMGTDLFEFVSDNVTKFDGAACGCLTQIKYDRKSAWKNNKVDEKLTAEIREDKRIPKQGGIRAKHLPLFAEWQRKIDKLYKRK